MPIQFTPVQRQFIECISAYLDNREPLELISREEQAELIRLAIEQKLIPMLYAVLSYFRFGRCIHLVCFFFKNLCAAE